MDIIITGLLLGGTYALIAMGLNLQYGVARIMNLANGEMLVAGGFAAFWLYTRRQLSPFLSIFLRGARRLRAELADLPRHAVAAGEACEVARAARSRFASCHLRPQLRRGGPDARRLRRRLFQLFLSRPARS
jgi:branched-subunit amino acid ABC-type transport system permease component